MHIPRFARDGRRASPSASCYLSIRLQTVMSQSLRYPTTERLAGAGGGHTLPIRQSVSRLREAASYTPGQRRHLVAGTGVAVCPFTPLLVAQGERRDRPGDPISPRRFKVFPSLAEFSFLDSSPLRSSFPGRDRALRSTVRLNRRLRPPGLLRSASQSGGYGALRAAPCTEMYDLCMLLNPCTRLNEIIALNKKPQSAQDPPTSGGRRTGHGETSETINVWRQGEGDWPRNSTVAAHPRRRGDRVAATAAAAAWRRSCAGACGAAARPRRRERTRPSPTRRRSAP